MSEVIRQFRVNTAPYTKGQPTMDGRLSPFYLPTHRATPSVDVPDVIIEGVPPVTKPTPKKPKRHTA